MPDLIIVAQLSPVYNVCADYYKQGLYMTALQHISAARDSRSIHNIEAMTLLVIYHLRSSASSHGLWYMIGLAMRTCIDLGLHRKNKEINRDPITSQRYRTLFWTVYSLERTISISLGRPVSIADRHIDVELPDVTGSIATSQTPRISLSFVKSGKSQSNAMAIHLFRIHILESRMHHSIYRTDKPLSELRQKLPRHYHEFEAWKTDLLRSFPDVDLDYPILYYHRANRLLLQPFLSILPCTDPYYTSCLESALEICHIHKRLHQTLDYGHSFIAVQTVFVAGVTLLFCVWTKTSHVWSVKLSNGIRACSNVLFVMGERTLWVKKYRDAFELLANATMEKLQGNLKEQAGILETALSVSGFDNNHRHYDQHHHYQTTQYDNVRDRIFENYLQSTRGDSGAMQIVNELASWIDQDAQSVWMPDFESLQGGTGHLGL